MLPSPTEEFISNTFLIFKLLVCVPSETTAFSIGNILFAIHGVVFNKEEQMILYWQRMPFVCYKRILQPYWAVSTFNRP